MKCGEIRAGEWLIGINDLDLTWNNMDSLLSAISTPKQVS